MDIFPIHQSLPSFLLIVLLFFTPASSAPEDNQQFRDCSPTPFDCGGVQLNIGYPFWTEGTPEHCRFPHENEIECNRIDNSFQIEIQSREYHVMKIDYEYQTATIVDKDYYSVNKSMIPCHAPSNITSPDLNLFNYTQRDLNISFLCISHAPSAQNHLLKFPNCSSDDLSDLANFTLLEYITDRFKNCLKVIPIPIHRTNKDPPSQNPGEFWIDVLARGFEVTWSLTELDYFCSRDCFESNGHCRFNETSPLKRACSCNGTQYPDKCPPPPPPAPAPGNGKRRKFTIIGAVAGVGFSLCLVACIFLCYRKKCFCFSLTSSKLLSRAISLNPSLKSDLEKSNSLLGTQFFDYKELEEATNNFDPSKELGDGGFGIVYHGKLRDGRIVAVKRLYENNCRCVEQFKNEIKILSHLRHRNLVTLYGCSSRHSRELLLVYEFIPNGTVADHLHGDLAKPGSFTWPTRMGIAIETADALKYLHAVDIIHRDVKTNNILLDNNFHVKVADFGLSRLFPTDVTHVSTAPQGTPGYVDPDYHRCYQLTNKSDVYSFGVVLIELISSKPAVDITRHRHEINLASMAISKIVNSALNELVDPTLGFESDHRIRTMITSVAGLAFRCLQDDKENRPSMEEVLESLRGIASEEYNVEKVEEVNTPADDEVLLKKMPPLSPVAVTDAWESRTTTPNTSG
ncbi:hypothetical protein AAC387_Pa05g3177 [Persea americana]